MNDRVRLALDSDRLVDITTTGRKTGKQHRIEVALGHLDGQIYLSNSPGKRDRAANCSPSASSPITSGRPRR